MSEFPTDSSFMMQYWYRHSVLKRTQSNYAVCKYVLYKLCTTNGCSPNYDSTCIPFSLKVETNPQSHDTL